MRGVAVLLAAGAAWLTVSDVAPRLVLPRFRLSSRAVVSSAAVAGSAAAVAMGLTGIPALAIAVGLLAATIPVARASARADEREWEGLRAWPDILAQVRSSLASGVPVTDALISALDRRSGIHAEMADLLRRESLFGGGMDAGVATLRARGLHPTSERVLVTLASASHSGGSRVGEIVGTLSRSVADDIRLREAHRAALTEQRMTIGVALVAPWAMLILAVVSNPQAAEAFGSSTGGVVIALGAAATAIGAMLARRAARLSAPPEVFR